MAEVKKGSEKKFFDQNAGFKDFVERNFDMDDHNISVEELCAKLGTDFSFGLTKTAVEARLARDGKNILHLNKKGHEFLRFVKSMFCIVSSLYWLTCVFSALNIFYLNTIYGETYINQIYIFTAAFINAIFIGSCFYVQTKRTKFMDIIPSMANREAEVIRDGRRMRIPTEELVAGDLILLRFGEQIPADIRLIESQNFKVDNFFLTGQHDPQLLSARTNESNLLESLNVTFFSAKVVEGFASGIVIRTGERTLLGWIFSRRRGNGKFDCPVTNIVIKCLNKTAILAAAIASIFFLIIFFGTKDTKGTDASTVALTLIIAIVPGKILRSMLLSYKFYSKRMPGKSCEINIRAIQKLPFVKIIFLNKQGTLTMDKITVASMWFDRKIVDVWGGTKMFLKEKNSQTFKEFAFSASLCNMAEFKSDQDNLPLAKREIIGNPNDAAIFKLLANTIGTKINKYRNAHPRIYWIPSSNTSMYQASIHSSRGNLLLILTGEPEYLIDKCTTYLMAGQSRTIDESFLQDIDKACTLFAKRGYEIHCIITQIIPEPNNSDYQLFKLPETGFSFIGIFSLEDIPLPDSAVTISRCRQAGIKIILTAKDHPITARSFARNVGLISENSQTLEEKYEEIGDTKKREVNAVVIDGRQLKLSVTEIEELLMRYQEVIFARISPLQKLMLLAICQGNDSMVAVVGDGVNDLTTMKKADLSIVLNKGDYTDSKFKGDVHLSDNCFYSLATCIEESWMMYRNLRKSIAFVMTSNLSMALGIIIYCILDLPVPINPITVVIVDLLFECFTAVALLSEKNEPQIMQGLFRESNYDSLCSGKMIFMTCAQLGIFETFACFFTYFIIMKEYGWTPFSLIGLRGVWESEVVSDLEDTHGQKWSYSSRMNLVNLCQTGYFYSLVLCQCANMLICRSQTNSLLKIKDSNWMIYFSLLFELSIMFFIIYLSHMNSLTQMKPLKPSWWVLPIPYIVVMVLYDEVKKYIIRKSPKGWLARETIY